MPENYISEPATEAPEAPLWRFINDKATDGIFAPGGKEPPAYLKAIETPQEVVDCRLFWDDDELNVLFSEIAITRINELKVERLLYAHRTSKLYRCVDRIFKTAIPFTATQYTEVAPEDRAETIYNFMARIGIQDELGADYQQKHQIDTIGKLRNTVSKIMWDKMIGFGNAVANHYYPVRGYHEY